VAAGVRHHCVRLQLRKASMRKFEPSDEEPAVGLATGVGGGGRHDPERVATGLAASVGMVMIETGGDPGRAPARRV
jgi:hypothetical protein